MRTLFAFAFAGAAVASQPVWAQAAPGYAPLPQNYAPPQFAPPSPGYAPPQSMQPPTSYAPPQAVAAPQNYAPPTQPAMQALVPAPASEQVGLVLSTGQALLWDDARKEYALRRVGEDVNGVRLVGVGERLVVLETASGQSVVRLLAPAGLRPATTAPTPAAGTFTNATQASATSPPATVEAAVDSPPHVQISRTEFDHELADFVSLGEEVTITQSATGNYRVAQVKPGSFVERLGLRAGDVLVSVDGRVVHTPDDAAKAYAWLRVTDKFRIDVLREGRPLTMQVDLLPASVASVRY